MQDKKKGKMVHWDIQLLAIITSRFSHCGTTPCLDIQNTNESKTNTTSQYSYSTYSSWIIYRVCMFV